MTDYVGTLYVFVFFNVYLFCQEIRLRAGMALAIFAFNNTQQQFAIREAGGISYSVFQDFLESENENYVCEAAFQVSDIINNNFSV